MRQRADVLLVRRGFFESRKRAQEAIGAGLVTAEGVRVGRSAELIPVEADITAQAPHPWVSRGALKLVHALDAFAFDPLGKVCLDVGASTGGFTEVLLARGAERIVAIDVGHGQMHPKLARDARVSPLEGLDARDVGDAGIDARPTLVVCDVSFISLRLVLPPVLAWASHAAELVALVKPQFEAGRGEAKKGIVRDPAIHARVQASIEALDREIGWTVRGLVPSPIEGGDGNREFLLGASRP